MTRSLLALALLIPALAAAQTPGSCTFGTATARLDAGDVDAGLYDTGSLFYGGAVSADYEVPRGSGGTALYAAGLWVGATVDGAPRVAAAGFYSDFWPGPLDAGATLPNPTDCSAYDHIYVVTATDVAAYEAGGAPTADLAAWPVGLGADAIDAAGRPVVPTSRSQTIDLAAGERPIVPSGQTAFWVMNDVGNAHTRTGSAPLGIEVQVTATAVASGALALRQSTAYRFRIVNRNTVPLEAAYATLFVDTDIGVDGGRYEKQGIDLGRNMAFTYRATETALGYGVPPAVGYDFLNTGAGAHRYALNGSVSPPNDPETLSELYNTQQGLWNDGTPQTASGSGYQTSGEVTRFAFPADPVTAQFWSEENLDGAGATDFGGNRRSITSTPAFSLGPGESTDVAVAVVFAQGADRLDSVTQLRAASDAVQAAYDAGALLPTAADDAPSNAETLKLGSPHPNPARGALTVPVSLPVAGRLRLVDVLGRTLLDVRLDAGARDVRLDAQRLAAGVYAVVLEAGDGRAVRTVTVVR